MFEGHDPYLVALSVAIAILGGYTGFGLTARIRGTPDTSHRLLLAGAAAVAQQGITEKSFPPGTIFSVKMNPLRDGSPFGSRAAETAIAKCPWKTPPEPGKTCDTVKGSEILGGTAF